MALLAGAALAYQIALMRLLSVLHWYPFAAMVVSLALLGHGVSGTLLALVPAWARRHYALLYVVAAALFAISMPLAFVAVQQIPFNGLELVWDLRQFGWLSLIYLLLSVPFGCVASCFGVAFLGRAGVIPRIYAADLVGAGLGAALVVVLMQTLPVHYWLTFLSILALLGALLGTVELGRHWPVQGVLALTALGITLLPVTSLQPRVNSYKSLSGTLLLEGARVVQHSASALGQIDVVASPDRPLRVVPGLSLLATQEPAAQLGVFIDGNGPSPVTDPSGGSESLRYLGQTTAALPYQLLASPRTLILGPGGGSAALQALSLGSPAVVVSESNPKLADLMRGPLAAFSGQLYHDPRLRLQIDDARNALRSVDRRYDLIVLPLPDSPAGAGAGVNAAADSFIYTVEAFRDGLAALEPNGMLSVTRWEAEPPRASLKLLATAIEALRVAGVAEPSQHLLMIRDWQTSNLLVTRAPVNAEQIAQAAAFSARWAFEVVYAPGAIAPLAARQGWLGGGVRALMGPDAERFIDDYKFDIRPARDNRPFFHNYFRWRSLPELWRLREHGAMALLDSGYLVMAAALLQAVPLAAGLILLPLLRLPRQAQQGPQRLRPGLYFFALGLAFLFVEIAALSRVTLYLGQPVWSAALVLASMLVFAGLGSALAARWRGRPGITCRLALAAALSVVLFEILHGPVLMLSANWALPAKAVLGLLLLAPTAIAMGMPFPLGLARLADFTPGLVPWAWAINGFASVISALLAVLLAMAFGYTVVVLTAAVLYLFAAWLWP